MLTDAIGKSELQLLRLYVGADCHCLETSQVASIRRWQEAKPANAELKASHPGVIAMLVHGKAQVPVYSLAERLGNDFIAPSSGPVTIVRSGDHAAGFQVDRVARAVVVSSTEPRQLPDAALEPQGRIRGTVRLNGELALYLSASRLIGANAFSELERPFAPAEVWKTSPPPAAQAKLLCLSEPGGDTSMLFGFALRQVVEIAQDLHVVRFAAGNPCALGVTDWRGYVVPVIDPGALLGLSQATTDLSRSRFAILRGTRSNQLFALPAADFAPLTLPLDSTVGKGTPMFGLGPYIRAAYEIADGCLVLPDLDLIASAVAEAEAA